MTCMCPQLTALRRPKLLVSAARHGAQLYSRKRDLRRLIGPAASRSHAQVLDTLSQHEHLLDRDRREKSPTYSARKHVMVLSALMAETVAPEAF